MIRAGVLAAGLWMGVTACATGPGRPADKKDYFDPALLDTGYSCGESSVVFAAMDPFEVQWFGSQLSAANEPSLYLASLSADRVGDSYRFTWLRSFHAPVVVRIDAMPDGAMHMTAKRLSGKGGYAPGRTAASIERDLATEESVSLRHLLEDGELARQLPVGCVAGVDGAQWIVETSIDGRYQYVNRWGGSARPVRAFGLLLLGFTGWDIDPLY